jgi:hypothetical protein
MVIVSREQAAIDALIQAVFQRRRRDRTAFERSASKPLGICRKGFVLRRAVR